MVGVRCRDVDRWFLGGFQVHDVHLIIAILDGLDNWNKAIILYLPADASKCDDPACGLNSTSFTDPWWRWMEATCGCPCPSMILTGSHTNTDPSVIPPAMSPLAKTSFLEATSDQFKDANLTLWIVNQFLPTAHTSSAAAPQSSCLFPHDVYQSYVFPVLPHNHQIPRIHYPRVSLTVRSSQVLFPHLGPNRKHFILRFSSPPRQWGSFILKLFYKRHPFLPKVSRLPSHLTKHYPFKNTVKLPSPDAIYDREIFQLTQK